MNSDAVLNWACGPWVNWCDELPPADEVVLMWRAGQDGKGPWVQCERRRDLTGAVLPQKWARIQDPQQTPRALGDLGCKVNRGLSAEWKREMFDLQSCVTDGNILMFFISIAAWIIVLLQLLEYFRG